MCVVLWKPACKDQSVPVQGLHGQYSGMNVKIGLKDDFILPGGIEGVGISRSGGICEWGSRSTMRLLPPLDLGRHLVFGKMLPSAKTWPVLLPEKLKACLLNSRPDPFHSFFSPGFKMAVF